MARDAIARAEIDIIYNAKKFEKLYATCRWSLYRVVRRFRHGNYFQYYFR